MGGEQNSPSTNSKCWFDRRRNRGPAATPAVHNLSRRRASAQGASQQLSGLRASWSSQSWRQPRSPQPATLEGLVRGARALGGPSLGTRRGGAAGPGRSGPGPGPGRVAMAASRSARRAPENKEAAEGRAPARGRGAAPGEQRQLRGPSPGPTR